MSTLLVVSLLLVGVMTVAVLVTLVALRRAPEGYEDETGFHRDASMPRKTRSGGTAVPVKGGELRTAPGESKISSGVLLAS